MLNDIFLEYNSKPSHQDINTIYQRQGAEDKLQCHLCETTDPPLHCDICDIELCTKCVGEHFIDVSKEHRVVPIEKKRINFYMPETFSKYMLSFL